MAPEEFRIDAFIKLTDYDSTAVEPIHRLLNIRVQVYILVLLLIVLISGCGSQDNSQNNFSSSSSADWAYRFVVWNDDSYVILEDVVNPDDIGEEVAEITQYSDFEGTYSNGFSNVYPKGTKLYRINGVETSEYIAIKENEEQYIKAKNNGKYGAKN